MNKITDITGSAPVAGAHKSEKSKNTLFQQNLAVARLKQAASEAHTAPTAALGEVQPTRFPILPTPAADVAEKATRLLDTLDIYTRDIADPKKSLKEIEPLIVSIRSQASRLAEAAEANLAEADALRRIAQESAVAATVEYVKFYRGDYNP